jgi:hypothetical protein
LSRSQNRLSQGLCRQLVEFMSLASSPVPSVFASTVIRRMADGCKSVASVCINLLMLNLLAVLKKRGIACLKCGGRIPLLGSLQSEQEAWPPSTDPAMMLCMDCQTVAAYPRSLLVDSSAIVVATAGNVSCYFIVCGCEDGSCKLWTRVFVSVPLQLYLNGISIRIDTSAVCADGHRLLIGSRTVRTI